MKILVINGPNLNMLGVREPEIYGKKGYRELVDEIMDFGKSKRIDISVFQSNHEGELVDIIQSSLENKYDGIIINPAAYTHTSVAILDALKAVNLPTIEVHLSEVDKREDFRKISYVSLVALKTISGKGFDGYLEAIECFLNK
ncbi:MAG TPA: type II 3-dehydroquinate dehydratase [Anaerovoracaceae bacterium]|nr:type II 3-dehydroquinate dehydratase [Anaerovoracaceae bacterium]